MFIQQDTQKTLYGKGLRVFDYQNLLFTLEKVVF